MRAARNILRRIEANTFRQIDTSYAAGRTPNNRASRMRGEPGMTYVTPKSLAEGYRYLSRRVNR